MAPCPVSGHSPLFYRSKHELVFVFKVGTAAHTNTFGLGDSGRYRSNVRDHAGVNTLRSGRGEDSGARKASEIVMLTNRSVTKKRSLSKPSKQQAFGKRHMQEINKQTVKRNPGEKRQNKRN